MESNTGSSYLSGNMKTMQLNDGKAGMQGLDKESINRVIYEATKGTPYFQFQEKRQNSIDSRVKELNQTLEKVTEVEKRAALKKMTVLGSSMECERDLSHSIVHVDMDAFYAAVEMEDNPALRGKPMAVGSNSMLSTSNYEARKYGVRAAMPGFIAKKLCPSLVIVPCNFERYRAVSKKVRSVIEPYDPDYCPASLDELYFDLTEYIKKQYKKKLHSVLCTLSAITSSDDLISSSGQNAEDNSRTCVHCDEPISNEERDQIAYQIVNDIRQKIFEVTNMTASAGIAPNVMLAKVCSDQNKPNGQYQIPSAVEAVRSFVSTLPVKKVPGIGPVQAQILCTMGINTCSDMWEKRDLVCVLFKSSSADFYLRSALGIASTVVKSEHVRKSIGVEQTFRETHLKEELLEKCQELCDEAVHDMQVHNMVSKVAVLKFKTTDFVSHTRNHTLPCHTADKDIISKAIRRLLEAEIASVAPKPLKLRLMGVRLANLTSEDSVPSCKRQQRNITTFLQPKPLQHVMNNASPHKPINENCGQEMQTCKLGSRDLLSLTDQDTDVGSTFKGFLPDSLNGLQIEQERSVYSKEPSSINIENDFVGSRLGPPEYMHLTTKCSEDPLERLDYFASKFGQLEPSISGSTEEHPSQYFTFDLCPFSTESTIHCTENPLPDLGNSLPRSVEIYYKNTEPERETTKASNALEKYETSQSGARLLKPQTFESSGFDCPVCHRVSVATSLEDLNVHVDNCLNRIAIRKILAEDLTVGKRKSETNSSNHSKRSKILNRTEKRIDDYFQ